MPAPGWVRQSASAYAVLSEIGIFREVWIIWNGVKPQYVVIAVENVVPVFGADPDVAADVFILMSLEDAGPSQGFIIVGWFGDEPVCNYHGE